MRNLSIHRTSELPLPARRAVEALLGRELADDEEVGVWASRAHSAPEGKAREEAWVRLHDHLEVMASKVQLDDESNNAEQLANEVAREVRHPSR
jgi:hypothetical protein